MEIKSSNIVIDSSLPNSSGLDLLVIKPKTKAELLKDLKGKLNKIVKKNV